MFGLKQKLYHLFYRKRLLAQLGTDLKRPLALDQVQCRNLSRNEQYLYCVYFFDNFLPRPVRQHRRYFAANRRGFGEDAFHAMWFLLFQQFQPARALEIGVYRGQTITLWKLLSRHLGFECSIGCVSPLTPAGDLVSKYEPHLDYYNDVVVNHQRFHLPLPSFCRHLSTSPEAKTFVHKQCWDVIYIDGSHDYEVAKQDWGVCSQAVASKGLIVLDDSALQTEFRPPCFSTAGHPGPTRVAREIDPSQFREIFSAGHNR